MLRLRTIAALVLCALCACTPITIDARPFKTPDTAQEQPDRFGNYTDLDARRTLFTRASTLLSDGSHVPWEGPFYIYNGTFWVDGESNSTSNSASIDVRGAHTAGFAIRMANTSTPVGNFAVHLSYDGTNSWMPIYIDVNRVYGQNFSAFSGGTSIGVSSPGGEVVIYVAIENPPAGYLRLVYTRSSGGAADTVDAFSLIRGM